MWEFGNRGVVALASTFTGCVFLYNVWGPILILTVSLLLTIYACYSLITNDSLFTPHAYLLFDYCKNVSVEVRANLESIIGYVYRYSRQFLEATNRRVRKQYLTSLAMERRRGAHYQLSNDSYPNRRESSEPENRFQQRSRHTLLYNHGFLGKHTSSPLYSQNSGEFENRTFELTASDDVLGKRGTPSPRHSSGLTRRHDTTYFSTDSPPWGTRDNSNNAEERKSMVTHAGPLSSSTRYNIDPKVYNDVTSPGLTARLTKYAAEASNKLTHRSQYRVGQFPKVNLHASPVPLINAKSVKTRAPVAVRVAPPDTVLYSSPTKQIVATDSHQPLNGVSATNASQALREISLKRQASREDVTFDPAKKQRTESLAGRQAEIQDETKQKRSRDEALKSEEEVSPQSKTVRPTKRSKTPSCYDIINSLSSSKHVVSGVKRKARDFSRSGTPDFEKHFKSVESGQSSIQSISPRQSVDQEGKIAGKANDSSACSCAEKFQERSPLKGILKTNGKVFDVESNDEHVHEREPVASGSGKDRSVSTESTRLTQKLFMRAEPERNEKLRMLVEEQGNIRAKFTTDDVEEIKREDIADMRQSSMKARLQSMFDAISGKAVSRINPDVVIQAEEVSSAVETAPCNVVTCATLNSSTTTTNVNTTPISTSAVAPSPGTSESKIKSPKHVAFDLPGKEMPAKSSEEQRTDSTFRVANESNAPRATTIAMTTSPGTSFAVTPGIESQPSVSIATRTNVTTSQLIFSASKSPTSAPIASTSMARSTFALGSVASAGNIVPSSFAPAAAANVSIFGNLAAATSTPLPAATVAGKTLPANGSTGGSGSNASSRVSPPKGGFTFGTNLMTANDTVTPGTQTAPGKQEIKVPAATTSASLFNVTTNSFNSSTVQSSSTTSTSLFTFGSKASDATANTKSNGIFRFGASESVAMQRNETFGRPTVESTAKNPSGTEARASSATTIATSTATFGSSNSTAASTFGSSAGSTFTFRGAVTSATSPPGKTLFSFGNASVATTGTTAPMNSSSTVSTAFTVGNTTSSFGASAPADSSTVQFPSTTGSVFASTTSASSIFGASTTRDQPIFGSPASSTSVSTAATFTLPRSRAPPVFGSTSSSVPLFSTNTAGPASTVSATSATTITTATAAAATTSSGLFSGASSITPSSSSTLPASSNIFGQATSPAATVNFKSGLDTFANNSSPSSLFGAQASASTTSSGTGFRSPNVTASSGSTSTFGATIPAASRFGTPAKTEAGGQSAQPFGTGSSIFGADNTAGSAFGRGVPSGAANPFTTSAPSNAFAGPSSKPAFGATNAPTGAFGAQAPQVSSAPATFGTVSNAETGNNNSTNVFTFGGNQKPLQQAGAFSFGGSNTAGSNAAPFQFTATATPSSGTGFNFSAPLATPSINFGTTSAVPTFNASAPGMFSIGSGSTAPRSRSMRARKPR